MRLRILNNDNKNENDACIMRPREPGGSKVRSAERRLLSGEIVFVFPSCMGGRKTGELADK